MRRRAGGGLLHEVAALVARQSGFECFESRLGRPLAEVADPAAGAGHIDRRETSSTNRPLGDESDDVPPVRGLPGNLHLALLPGPTAGG
ncbi:hypothetical protein E1286_20510 [Nonomuraea terrae]|uniref:Uncharacterized protein n=1 Tax=Nonomuraea terrae TaxID=2530383 RepID=A0A4R4YSQ4_9ACTN|nr:hypothetical protein [Nonomuraea terrae]TDD46612.1 hypothetical protein E1286_20510 [Nonomuraea terrae]